MYRDVNGLKKKKKKKRKSMTTQWMQPSLQYLIVCPYSKTLLIDGCIVFLAFYKSGWQCLLEAGFEGDGRDLFLTTLVKGRRAVSESECTWLSIIISQMLWLLMHCLVLGILGSLGLDNFCELCILLAAVCMWFNTIHKKPGEKFRFLDLDLSK